MVTSASDTNYVLGMLVPWTRAPCVPQQVMWQVLICRHIEKSIVCQTCRHGQFCPCAMNNLFRRNDFMNDFKGLDASIVNVRHSCGPHLNHCRHQHKTCGSCAFHQTGAVEDQEGRLDCLWLEQSCFHSFPRPAGKHANLIQEMHSFPCRSLSP